MTKPSTLQAVLAHYSVEVPGLDGFTSASHDRELQSHRFEADGTSYVLVEAEGFSGNLMDEEYDVLKADLGFGKDEVTLVEPTLEQMYTTTNQAGNAIDGHRAIKNIDEVDEAEQESYKNPYDFDTDSTFVLFEVKG